MTNIKNEGEEGSGTFEEKQLKKLVMLAAVGLKLGRQIYEKLESVEISVEMIAREVVRKAERGE